MLTKYDLYDLSAVFQGIRFDIKDVENPLIIDRLICLLHKHIDDPHTTQNEIRIELSQTEGLKKEKWDFVFYRNLYVNCSVLKNKNVYILFIDALEYLKNLLLCNEYKKADDSIDALHNLPENIANNSFIISKKEEKSLRDMLI